MQIFSVVGVILSSCCVVCQSPELLFLGRMMFGILAGIGNIITPIYLAEIATPRIRGALCVCHQLTISTGILIGSILGIPELLSAYNRWQYLFLVNLIPFFIGLLCLPRIPLSPRYLYLVRL